MGRVTFKEDARRRRGLRMGWRGLERRGRKREGTKRRGAGGGRINICEFKETYGEGIVGFNYKKDVLREGCSGEGKAHSQGVGGGGAKCG